ncbi:PotD/PotF family extracellular solute-binding protein [Salinisphaera sp. Q1T1-3]|uniref:ABC transporter substrate-binding protein n=1 Tax=Salinisphaera sp. Q1T1-3 TaxID=2321229 RepID=UPI000E70A9E7|nr:spermidine/putrescine ABC transporter substrate-binding protein [Salinisphaera sp. Q1T1-3]RJS93299.1 spermidine/putrescine ABC transporter substrate-binding protein [Salinisphaera sp. Q1T1-3]
MINKRVGGVLAAALLVGVAALASPLAMAQDKARTLYLFNWSQYMDPAIIKAFEKQYDVKVVQTYYNSQPEMFAKLRAGGDSQYDVVVPSSYYVPRLIHTGLLQPLDKKAIPNYSNLMPRFSHPDYDPDGKYVAAYQWGDTGIAYNVDKLGEQPESWSILFDPKANAKYPFDLGTDAQVMLGSACAALGHGYDCTDRDQLKKAAQLILKTKQRRNFSGFEDATPTLKQLARGNIVAGVAYNGDYAFDKQENPQGYKHIKFIVPKEGAELWVDSMAIPAHAPHPRLANQFINFILDAKIGAQLSNYNAYASPNKAARPYLDKALTEPPIMPSDAEMKRLHFTPSIAGDQLQFVQQLWTEVQSR